MNRNKRSYQSALEVEYLEKRQLLSGYDGLRVTEIMYHPDPVENTEGYTSGDFEYIELGNAGSTPIAMANVKISSGTSYTFGAMTLNPGEYVTVASNPAALGLRYDLATVNLAQGALGEGLGSLDERIKIEVPDATKLDGYRTIIDFTYNPEVTDASGNPVLDKDGNPVYDIWYPITDKGTFSLTLDNVSQTDYNDHNDRDNWRPSSQRYGTPGQADTLNRTVVVSEVLAHSDEVNGDWIELHNLTNEPVDIGNWFLSDDLDALKKYQIAAGTVIPANGYLVFNQMENFGYTSTDPGAKKPFGLSEYGDIVILSSGDQLDADENIELTGMFEEKDFGASTVGVSFGRYEKTTETYNFVAMSVNTPGSDNAAPMTGPLVISEVMYHPVNDQAGTEYVELFNVTDEPVTLQVYDSKIKGYVPWKFTSGIDYEFPLDTTIGAGERVIIAENPAVFQATYGDLADNPLILGPFANQTGLSNKGERLEVGMPVDELTPDGLREYIRIDRVKYDDKAPWPVSPDGDGNALVRVNAFDYGNDPANWAGKRVLNAPAVIGSLSVQPDPVVMGTPFTLTASGSMDYDGAVGEVYFYHDSNHNLRFDSQDELLGVDGDGTDGWQWQGTAASLYNGTNTFYAAARDTEGKFSSYISTDSYVTAPNMEPTIGAVVANPQTVKQGESFDLTANNVKDTDGTVARCEFYVDVHSNGAYDSQDIVLGKDFNGADWWSWQGSADGIPVGTWTVLARVYDNEGASSGYATTAITVQSSNERPTIGGLTASTDVVERPNPFGLTAEIVQDTDGSVSRVNFYADSNGDGLYDEGDQLLGSDTDGADGWHLTVDSESLAGDSAVLFARATDNLGAVSDAEKVTVQLSDNQRPVIGGLDVGQSGIVNPDQDAPLTATGVNDPDNGVAAVRFYLDSNQNGILEPESDLLAGVDDSIEGGWMVMVDVSSMDSGSYEVWAVAVDTSGAESDPVSGTLGINARPLAGVLSSEPERVVPGTPLTLSLTGTSDSDGTIAAGEFYLDVNGNAIIDENDRFMGRDTYPADGLSLVVDTSGLGQGDLTFLADVIDNNNLVSTDAAAVVVAAENYTVDLDGNEAKSIVFVDEDDTQVEIKLSKGVATFGFEGEGLDHHLYKKKLYIDGYARLASIELTDPISAAGTLSIKTRGGDGLVELGDIRGGGLKSISAKTAILTGDIDMSGNLAKITLKGMAEASSLSIGSAGKGVSLKTETIGDQVRLDIADTLKSLQANVFVGGQVSADAIKSVKIKSGNLGADLTAEMGDITSVSVYGDITGTINAAGTVKKVYTRFGNLGADVTAVMGDITTVSVYGDITGTINASGTVKKVSTRIGELDGAVVRAGDNIGKVSAYSISDSMISSGQDVLGIQSKTDIVDSLLMSGYDIGPDAVLGTGDDVLNENDAVILKSIKTGKTGLFDGSLALAGIQPFEADTVLAVNPIDQVLNPQGGTIKSVSLGQVWQGQGGEATSPYGLFAATDIGKVSVKSYVSGANAPGEFTVRSSWGA